jgi:ArsR family transcriptional regulator, arsenate/arsenite/antimonite-responsive transcriptional repressor
VIPGPPKITLDQESFKALASEVRVEILKRLDERRQTVTDLSNLLSLSKPTLLEHLEKLQSAGLVKRVDEGRKWIYYELSEKGRRILRPERVAIVIALANTVALVVVGLIAFLVTASPALTANPFSRGAAAPSQSVSAPLLGVPDLAWLGVVALALAAVSMFVVLLLIRTQRRRTRELFSQIAAT